jgi:hypothetical protein
MRPLLAAALAVITLSACGTPRPAATDSSGQPVSAAPVRTAGDLVQLARATWSERFYRTLTFRQTTTFMGEEGTRSETWLEALEAPGRLRIDLPEAGAGNVVLFRGDSTYIFRDGAQVAARDGGNPLLQLAFDIDWRPTNETLNIMADLGIDTAVVGTGRWAGRPAWIVGADDGNTRTPQLWFDRERLVFLRLIEVDDGEVTDIRFERYLEFAGGWIAPWVEIYRDGELVMTEEYHDLRGRVDLPAGTFSPVSGPTVRWWD